MPCTTGLIIWYVWPLSHCANDCWLHFFLACVQGDSIIILTKLLCIDWTVHITCQRKWCWSFCLNHVIQIKHMPVGDALWIARHKELDTEYVLDFIVERKSVTDLVSSIRDSRYKDQKLRLKVPSELVLTIVIIIISC